MSDNCIQVEVCLFLSLCKEPFCSTHISLVVLHRQLADAENASGDRDSLLGWMMLYVIGAPILVTSAVHLVSAIRVLVTIFAEVGICTASVLSHVAAEVALEL